MRLLFYISGHGFGHAARDVEIINAVSRRRPDTHITVRTEVPDWFLRASLQSRVDRIPGDIDTGLVQPDGLTIDEDETARRAARFYETFPARISREVAIIGAAAPDLVLGDIPPLAHAAAHAAGIPSIAVGNFTWDWIYQGYPQFEHLAPGVVEQIADAYAHATLALRLPFSGGFASMPRVEAVPLVARLSRVPRHITRERLHLDDARPLVLASFGGHGGSVSLDKAAASGAFVLVATDFEANKVGAPHSNLRVIPADTLRRAELSYTDLLASADVVVSKLGYGIVSECIASRVPLLYTFRGRFVEQDIFVQQMPEVLRCRHIDTQHLRDGDWTEAVRALLAQPEAPRVMPTNGAQVVADRILSLARGA
ncbi:MAG: hypothetical protein ABMA15_15870 [Vicinamibacterales bacterium]